MLKPTSEIPSINLAAPKRLSFFARLIKGFEPETDFYALLSQQATTTVKGMEALSAWLQSGAQERGQLVRDLEKEADEQKMALVSKLAETFITPLDREDIYDLSMRLDDVINAAKTTVREVEAVEMNTKDTTLIEMADSLVEGTRCISLSFSHMQSNMKEAYDQASLARKAERRVAKLYREAITELFHHDDVKKILKAREVYRCLVTAGERIDVVGEKLQFVAIKMT